MTTRLADQIGRVLGGRYRLVAPIGMGASARVFLADDVKLRRRVAVKVLHEGLAGDTTFLRRFRAEAQAAAALQHPHVMSVYDWGDDDGPYLVLEHLGGGSLRSLLDAGHRLSVSQALQVGLEAARALDYAHRRGIVHRDIKPANLLFDTEARLRIADFGLARALADAAVTEPQGVLVGTARYASPEQVRGESVDGKADVYALALVLVEAVTGEVPFAADTALATALARRDRPMDVPEALGELRPVLEAAGSNDPSDRPDAATLGQRFFEAAEGLPAPAPLPLEPPADRAEGLAPAADLTAHGDRREGSVAAATPAPDPTDALTTVAPATPGATDTGAAGDGPPAGSDLGERRRRWPRRLALAAVLVAAGAAAVGFMVAQPPSYEVPELVGNTEEEATSAVAALDHGWEVEVVRQYVDGTEAGRVVSTDPPPGADLRQGSTLELVVSRGPTPVSVPDTSGLDEPAAVAALREVGLVAGEPVPAHDEEAPPGTVISWQHEGEDRPRLLPRGSEVRLVISQGPAPRTVPELAGATFEQAAADLEELGLVVAREDVFSSEVDEGIVVGTSPGAGESASRGSEVTVRVSKGPDLVEVPNVRDRTLDEAIEILEGAGLEVAEVEGNPRRRVLVTDPEAGARVERGTRVTVYMRGS